PHEGGAVGFTYIAAVDKKVNHADISAIVIDLELPACQTIEQTWTHIPVPLKGKARAIVNPIGATAHFAILCLHQQKFEIIWGSQILRNSCLAHRFFPQNVSLLPT